MGKDVAQLETGGGCNTDCQLDRHAFVVATDLKIVTPALGNTSILTSGAMHLVWMAPAFAYRSKGDTYLSTALLDSKYGPGRLLAGSTRASQPQGTFPT